MLDILVPQVSLQGPRIVALVRQRKATGVPEHVRMALEAELGSFSGALHLRAKPAVVKRSATFLNVLRANTWPARIDSRLDPLIRRWSFLFVCEKGNADANAY